MDAAFATLTPANALTKIAFSDVYDAILDMHGEVPAIRYMSVRPQQEFNRDVELLQYQMDKPSDSEFSESPTEPETDDEPEKRTAGTVWVGCYVLGNPPAQPELGWLVGKLSPYKEQSPGAEIAIATAGFTKRHNLKLRTQHARFNFLENGSFFFSRYTSSLLLNLAVNATSVDHHPHSLNQHKMRLRIGPLEYDCQYTRYASSEPFLDWRRAYLAGRQMISPSPQFEMPTPLESTRTVGQWTLSTNLGKGAVGKVFLASNSRNDVVAIKTIEVTRRNSAAVDAEIRQYRRLTALASQKESEWLVRVRELIDPRTPGFIAEDVALVLEPMTPHTLTTYIKPPSRGSRDMRVKAVKLFQDTLSGLAFLHENRWIHGDIKPANIGVRDGDPARAVLLDLGQASQLPSSRSTLPPTPGRSGTVNYLAPEREMVEYGCAVDIWGLGVIGFELLYGSHPFKFSVNPWRHGAEYEILRPAFQQQYGAAIARLAADSGHIPAEDCVQVHSLIIEMLKHPFAQNVENRDHRITAMEALKDAAWGPISHERGPKRVKR